MAAEVHLQALDLHWNKIDACDASAIFQGCLAKDYRVHGRGE